MMKMLPRALASVGLAAVFLTGCETAQPEAPGASDAPANVVIEGVDVLAVRDAIVATFQANSFTRNHGQPGMVFDRRGDTWRQLQFGSVMGGAAYDRVKVRVDSTSPTRHLVSARGYVVTSRESMLGDDERPVSRFNSGPYQNLLGEVQARAERGR